MQAPCLGRRRARGAAARDPRAHVQDHAAGLEHRARTALPCRRGEPHAPGGAASRAQRCATPVRACKVTRVGADVACGPRAQPSHEAIGVDGTGRVGLGSPRSSRAHVVIVLKGQSS